jgi:hypothetical protein
LDASTTPDATRQFSLRTLLIAVTAIAFVMGYSSTFPALIPRWHDLMRRIDASRADVATEGWLWGKGIAFQGWSEPGPMTYLVGFLVLVSFYASKVFITRWIRPRDLRILAFVVLLCFTLTYIYLYWTEWGNGLIFYIGNWLLDPVAVLAVPTVTFLHDTTREALPSVRRHVIRSTIELMVVTPIWYYIWAFIALLLGLFWI